jgi:hypothetical protein
MLVRAVCWAGSLCLVFTPLACGQPIDLSNPRTEAEYLALEVTGQLTPNVSLADQIQADLAAIRLAYPEHASIRVFPSWMPGESLVGLTPAAYSDFKAGTFNGFDSLYATLGTPTVRTHDTGQWLHLQFGKMYHGVRLSEQFDPVVGVRYAEPNGILGDGDDIVARLNRTYTLSHGFGDCPAGCIYRESWDYTVTDEGVFLGTPPTQEADGDYNNDGLVDTADYVLVRNGWGSSYNEAHYDAWRNSFGGAPGSGSGAFASVLVPEPTSGILLILGLVLARLHSGRRSLRP